MAYRSLREFLVELEKAGELVRVSEPVSTVLEMTEIQTRLLATGGPAVLFEKPILANGEPSPMPALANLFGTVRRVAMGVTLEGRARSAPLVETVIVLSPRLLDSLSARTLGLAVSLGLEAFGTERLHFYEMLQCRSRHINLRTARRHGLAAVCRNG